ncbi:MAG: ABC transporter permease subunit [Anaerolineales bacterium]
MNSRSNLSAIAVTVLRRLGLSLLTLLIIAYLTLFGLIMAERGREGLPAEPLSAATEALSRTANYVTDHPATYYWNRFNQPALDLVATTFGHSAGLLLVSLGTAVALGVPLGTIAALRKRKGGASLIVILSILGISTPSFLLAMLFWVLNIQIHRRFGVTVLPSAGFGWDTHLIMPALVLAARPLAQIAQVTYVSLSEILDQDFIRTAHAKGLRPAVVRRRHAIRNVLIPILTTVGTSLRFSLASLPVVEYFFEWPGVGLMLLEAIQMGITPLVTDLIVSLGLLFLLINLAIEVVYPLLDPRLKEQKDEKRRERRSPGERLSEALASLRALFEDLQARLPGRSREPDLRPLPPVASNRGGLESPHEMQAERTRWALRALYSNPALIAGTLLVLGFFALALFGERLTAANPTEIHGVMMVEGVIGAPPYEPSPTFPWGTDYLGRDMQALVLAGTTQTLALALFGMLARVLLGTLLGIAAGWWQHSAFDRLVNGAVGVWAAFPLTIFAMLLIQGLGIQQGMWVFIVALSVVGWGEVAQFVRGQVITLKPQLYIEAAQALGARTGQILGRHILPNLLPSLLVLAVLETGGVLMLLAELGYLNIFLGGGFKVELIGEVINHFSDVPEWGALLANVRQWWRSYPWMAWYPGLAFFLAILAFNVWGEGLRRFLAESRINLGHLFNRYTLLAGLGLVIGLGWVLRSTAPLGVYRSQAERFEATRAMEYIEALTAPEFEGRRSGSEGAARAAEYIAAEMKALGLQPAGRDGTYYQTMKTTRLRITETPVVEMVDGQGAVVEAAVYGEDFLEVGGFSIAVGEVTAPVVGLALGPLPPESSGDPYGLRSIERLRGTIAIVHEEEAPRVNFEAFEATLIVTDDPAKLKRRLFAGSAMHRAGAPLFHITPELGERLLESAGSSLAQLEATSAGLQPGDVAATASGAPVHVSLQLDQLIGVEEHHVIGFIPGTGAAMGSHMGAGMDNEVILLSAYYDGLGIGPDGTFYPGANDNASGVAALLEIARALQEGPYPPKRTVVFVAWAGGERSEGLSVDNVMNAKLGFRELSVEVVLELSGVGAGEGEGVALGQGSSYRLVRLFQKAAGRLGISTTTRGRGPHYGFFVRPGFGGREALSAYLSWDGSDLPAHTPQDTPAIIDPEKLDQTGELVTLVTTVLSREPEY